MKLFLDNCIAPRHARALHAIHEPDGHLVRHLKEMYAENTTDIVWLPDLDARGDWWVLTKDNGIMRKQHERDAWMQSSLVVCFLNPGWNKMNLHDSASAMQKAVGNMLLLEGRARKGSGYTVRINGKLDRLFLGHAK